VKLKDFRDVSKTFGPGILEYSSAVRRTDVLMARVSRSRLLKHPITIRMPIESKVLRLSTATRYVGGIDDRR